MQPTLDWHDIALRLTLTLAAGMLVGLNRGEHGRPAGLRTTMMVSLAASLAMILANLMLETVGKHPDSFVNIDPMRLPLGILTGMGFIGAGAVLRRKDTVTGITTASTLWLVTVVGLCMGSGHFLLGLTATVLALIVLEGLWWVDRAMHQDRHAMLVAVLDPQGPSHDEISAILTTEGFWIASYAVTYLQPSQRRRIACEVRWRGRLIDFKPPEVLEKLIKRPGVLKLQWRP
ncbi:MAG: MgtC/SapB family protein [Tepidisphaeraceae bacterium]|jgi:putative Mg2+ transporter-C (MgtC) family protein